jgi:site-specific DNA-methyltransferase (adenine-specific)
MPTGAELECIIKQANISELLLRLKMGCINGPILEAIQNHAEDLIHHIKPELNNVNNERSGDYVFETSLGKLYQGNCTEFLKSIESDSVDLIFADPPFNLSKLYPSEIDDNLKTEKYLNWCEQWLYECARVLKPGGSLFIWNLPKWNASLTACLNSYLTFRHWIGVDIKYSLPIKGRLYPSHYSLLYYVKGDKPNAFHPDRLSMQVCPKCYHELKDYGGYKDKMNPKGINITDIWTDIPPVRHAKYKRRTGSNELSLKLLDRIIEMSSEKGDLILDPFGGSGTTYMAAELKGRRWLGSEIGPIDVIVDRFNDIDEERLILNKYRDSINALFPGEIKKNRIKKGLWTSDDFSDE